MRNDAASSSKTVGADQIAISTPASGTPTIVATRFIPSCKPVARSIGVPASPATLGKSTYVVDPAPRTAPTTATTTASAQNGR